jgi:hypothetical protein
MQLEFNAKTQIRTNYGKTLRVGRKDAKEGSDNGFLTNFSHFGGLDFQAQNPLCVSAPLRLCVEILPPYCMVTP